MKITMTRNSLAKVLAAALIAPLLSAIGTPTLIYSSNAAATLNSTSMQLTPISWNIVGLDSNNVNVGPNQFPVGAKICNKTNAPLTPTFTWKWHESDASALSVTGPTRYTVTNFTGTSSPETLSYTDTIPASVFSGATMTSQSCVYAFWTVQIVRASASYFKTRKFSISANATIGGSSETVSTDPDIALRVEKLVSQARNDVTSLTVTGSLANNGDTATITLNGATSTAYEQLTVWPVMDLSVVRIRSMNFTFSNDSSTRAGIDSPLKQIYADACGWNPLTNACDGDGKVGGTSQVTMVVERVAAGNFAMAGVIYDRSGSSYHYNSDFGTDGILGSAAITGGGGAPAGVNLAIDDNYSTPYNTVLNGTTIGVNDTKSGTPFYELLTPLSYPPLALNSTDGTFVFVPTGGFRGIFTFDYRLCTAGTPPTACSETATVTIAVGIQASNDEFSIDYQGSLPVGTSVKTNDFYVAPAKWEITTPLAVTGGGSAGTLVFVDDGTFSYVAPNGYSGSATFSYRVCTPDCGTPTDTSNATVTIFIGPLAVNDSYRASSGGLISASLGENDIKAPGVTYALVSTTNANGSVTLDPTTGIMTYRSVDGFAGTASFTYQVCDAQGSCSVATVTVTVSLPAPVVVLETPTITWPTPAPQVGPYNLGSTQLNAICSVPGTLTYDPATSTLLQPGTYTLRVTCTPTSPAYRSVSTQVPFTVTRPTASITWNDPSPVVGPYVLDPSVLNAICSQPGTLAYDPALGTSYQPGSYTLRVTCTPTNTIYAPVSTSVTLRVVPPVQITVPLQVIPGIVITQLAIPSTIAPLNPTIVSLCPGISSAQIQSTVISYTPAPTFSGRTCINTRVLVNGVYQNVQVPVLVNPVAPNATKEPVTFMSGLINWTASPNAIGYKVEIRGVTICQTESLSCAAPQTVGPATPVFVTALGNDQTSTTVEAKYIAKKVLAFTVYFDVAKFNLKPSEKAVIERAAAIIKKEGFTQVFVVGHTDSSPYDNKTLSTNRARTSLDYLLLNVPTLVPSSSAKSDKVPAASNKTPQGKTLNRRAEGYVY